MARYIIQEASKWYTDERKPKYTIKFKDEEKTLTNKVIVGQNKVKYEFDETINRYDANDSIIDYFIDNDDTLNESKILDPEYISFEMIIKLALNGFDYLIPENYQNEEFIGKLKSFSESAMQDETDMEKLENQMMKYISDIKKKNARTITEDKIKYIEEEKRALTKEKDEIDTKLAIQLNEMASLIQRKNSIYSRILELK